MSSVFGLTSEGFNKKLLANINQEMSDDAKALINPNLNTTATAILGQFLGIPAAAIAGGWDVLESIHNNGFPDSAVGQSLDGIGAITGAIRESPAKSTATLVCTGDDLTALPVGRQASVGTIGSIFETTQAAVITPLATAWAPTTAYAVGDRRSNDTPTRIYVATVGGTSSGSGGPTGTGTSIVDGTVTWRFLGEGEAFVDVPAESSVTGPIVGQAFTITTIDTPVSGWLGVNNQLDAVVGMDLETDPTFRQRREALIRATSKATVEAIRAAALNVTGVIEALVFENTSLITDPSGIPGKAFEAVVLGGTDVDVAQAIFDTKPIGIQAFGDDISESIVDSQGTSHLIQASRPVLIEMFSDVTVVTDGSYPADGDAQVAQALVDLGATLKIGDDVIFEKFKCAPFEVSGVVDITASTLDKRPVTVTSGNTETYALVDGQTLTVKVNNESVAQTATFNTADFVDIANATAAEVALVITTDISGATAADVAGAVAITSDATGTIEVTGGTANAVLGFPTTFTPTGTANVSILTRQLARFDTSRINVTSV
ncbi:MAG: hypothetical protein MJA83_05670 [Gammaproteobacteria bacterium]|nr:hypothetical protein [Gammaproteobacteria bacterium]